MYYIIYNIYILPKPFQLPEAFQSMNLLISLQGPEVNTPLLQTPTYQCVWPHHASSTRT